MENNLLSFFTGWGEFVYILIFLGMLLEGNATMLIVGFLLGSSALSPMALIFSAFLGALIEQFFWYWFGVKIKNSPSRFAEWVIAKSNHFDEHFIHRPKTTLLISKFIYGIHRAAVARAGVIGIGFKTYMKYVVPVLLLWMLIVGGAGFLLKKSFGFVDDYIKYVEIGLLGLLILVILLQRFVLSGKLRDIWKNL